MGRTQNTDHRVTLTSTSTPETCWNISQKAKLYAVPTLVVRGKDFEIYVGPNKIMEYSSKHVG